MRLISTVLIAWLAAGAICNAQAPTPTPVLKDPLQDTGRPGPAKTPSPTKGEEKPSPKKPTRWSSSSRRH